MEENLFELFNVVYKYEKLLSKQFFSLHFFLNLNLDSIFPSELLFLLQNAWKGKIGSARTYSMYLGFDFFPKMSKFKKSTYFFNFYAQVRKRHLSVAESTALKLL